MYIHVHTCIYVHICYQIGGLFGKGGSDGLGTYKYSRSRNDEEAQQLQLEDTAEQMRDDGDAVIVSNAHTPVAEPVTG